MADNQTRLGCSVVVCCYSNDRWQRLVDAVTVAAAQLQPDDELVVVVDHNRELLSSATSAFTGVAQVITNRYEPGLSGARNTGVDHATRPLVVFLDDDAVPGEDWIQHLTAPFADPHVVGVGGSAAPNWADGTAPWWMPAEFYWVVGCSYTGLPMHRAPIRNPIGANMAFRADAIREVGGFSAKLGRVNDKPVGGEETDLAIRIRSATGGTILYEPAATVSHAVEKSRMTLQYFARRCYFEGRSKAVLAHRVGAGDATTAERSYLKTLAKGVGSRFTQSARERTWRPLGQALVLVLGLTLTTIGFGLGTLVSLISIRR
ncbi:MAG: glycosyltransferase family 2 protein [bacterium]|nr:glycosyltransferase family 2 protein [bacterium]